MVIFITGLSADAYAYEADDIFQNGSSSIDVGILATKPPTKDKNLASGSVSFSGDFCYRVYSEYNFITSTGKIVVDLASYHSAQTNRDLQVTLYDEDHSQVGDPVIIKLSATGGVTTKKITFSNLSTTKKYYIQWAAGDRCVAEDYVHASGTISQ